MKKGKRPFYSYWDSLSEAEQEALAKKMGTNRIYLYQIAIDFRNGSPRFIKKLEKHTGIPKEKMLPEVFA